MCANLCRRRHIEHMHEDIYIRTHAHTHEEMQGISPHSLYFTRPIVHACNLLSCAAGGASTWRLWPQAAPPSGLFWMGGTAVRSFCVSNCTCLAHASRMGQVPQRLWGFEVYRSEANLHRQLFSLRDRFLGSAVVFAGSPSRTHLFVLTCMLLPFVLTFPTFVALIVNDRQP